MRKKIQVEQEITKTEVNEVTARSSGSNGSEDVGKAISGDNVQHLNKKSSGAEDSAAPGVDKEKSKFSESPTMLPTVDGRTIEAEQNSVTAVATDFNNVLTRRFAAKGPPVYNPGGKIDPFMPLFKEETPQEEVMEETPKRKKRIPRTPLERIDLSQLELVGVVRAPAGNKGLVEESSGKGYIVSKGTYMGRNGGRVTDILKDRVIVQEEVVDVLGKPTVQKKVLKLQKPFGED